MKVWFYLSMLRVAVMKRNLKTCNKVNRICFYSVMPAFTYCQNCCQPKVGQPMLDRFATMHVLSNNVGISGHLSEVIIQPLLDAMLRNFWHCFRTFGIVLLLFGSFGLKDSSCCLQDGRHARVGKSTLLFILHGIKCTLFIVKRIWCDLERMILFKAILVSFPVMSLNHAN